MFAATLLHVTYGITIEDESNEYLVAAETWQHGFNQAILPGRFWVDYFPIREYRYRWVLPKKPLLELVLLVKYVPAWIPGAKFKRLAQGWREHMYTARDRTFDLARSRMVCIPC